MSEHQLDLFTAQRAGEYAIAPDAMDARCRSCGAAIVWAVTPAGHAVPLSMATVEEREGIRYALNHFSDCPQGKEWRRKR